MLRRAFNRRCFSTKPHPTSNGSSHVNINLGNISMSSIASVASSSIGLDKLGITNPSNINRNLSYEDLMRHEKKNGEGSTLHYNMYMCPCTHEIPPIT